MVWQLFYRRIATAWFENETSTHLTRVSARDSMHGKVFTIRLLFRGKEKDFAFK